MTQHFRFLALSVLALGVLTASAQSPSPAEVAQARQIVQSGVPITPDMINAAKTQFPDLRKYSDSEIQRIVAERRQQAEETQNAEAKPDAADGAATGENIQNVSGPKQIARADSLKAPKDSIPNNGIFPDGLSRFGQDFFQNADPAGLGSGAPALAEYILSPGDEIQVSTWGRESRSVSVLLNNEGMFQFPPLAPMRLSGMRFEAAQRLVISEIEKIHGVEASVSLGRLRSIRVMVLGEAVRPGSFVVPAGATVTSVLFRSGGVTPIGSLRAIEVRRDGKSVATLDIYEMMMQGKSKGDIQLLPGDAVFIPLAGPQVAVQGMVKRPAIYEIKPGTKALDAVTLAGGLRSDAYKGRLMLDRVQGNKRRIAVDVDMEKTDAKSNVRLEDGDILSVDRVLGRVEDAVWLRGNVYRVGRYQFKAGMTVRDLIPELKDLRPETFFEYAHIKRPSPDDGRATLKSFPLGDIFTKGLRVPLEPGDTVMVYGRRDVAQRPTVAVSGEVRRPSVHPFSESMRVSDLIILGGGLGDAFLPEAHILRLQGNGDNDSMYAQILRVNLKSVLEDPTGEANVELRPFDRLVVFPRENFVLRKSVTVYGAVKSEGTFDLAEGMGIPELVKMAGGLTRHSFKLGIEVVRRKIEKDSVLAREILKMNLKDILDGTTAFQLQDGDGVYIREIINSRTYRSVFLTGEFNFPGRYEFIPGEKLSSVVRRAGGFTQEAYLRGAVFIRQSVREQQLRHADEISRRLEAQLAARMQQATQEHERSGISLAMERNGKLLNEISKAPYLGRVVISIDKKMKFARTDWDLDLENGDSLWIGTRLSTVSVLGEVSSPTTAVYTRKTDQVGEVLAKAGGVSQYGNYRETFYIAPDGSITTPRTVPWYSSFKCKKVEPGGTIIVPMKPPEKDYLEVWAQSSQILYNLAVSVGVAVALF